MDNQIFKDRKMNIPKLLSYGFEKHGEEYLFSTPLVNGEMNMTVRIDFKGNIDTKVIDCSYGEEYVLHRVFGAVGSFVSRVKSEYERVLGDISDKCFEFDVFKAKQSKLIIRYVREKYNDELEHLWEKSPENAIWRRKDNRKWYAALLTVKACKIGLESDESIEIIDLRIKPEELEGIIDCKSFFPGYHMNKKHWFTIVLDGTVPTEEICRRIDESFVLAKK